MIHTLILFITSGIFTGLFYSEETFLRGQYQMLSFKLKRLLPTTPQTTV